MFRREASRPVSSTLCTLIMTSAALNALSSSPVPSVPVHGGETRDVPVKEDIGASKRSLITFQELSSSPIPPEPLTLIDASVQDITIEKHAKASKVTLVEVEEIPLSLTSLGLSHHAEEQISTTEVHVKDLEIPLVGAGRQGSRYHENDTAHYCLPNEQVYSESTQRQRA